MNQMAERMISNKSPAKTINTINGTSLKGFFVRGPFDFSIIRTLKPACGPQPAKNKGLKSFYQCTASGKDKLTTDWPQPRRLMNSRLTRDPKNSPPKHELCI
jgi:hypothetical protein